MTSLVLHHDSPPPAALDRQSPPLWDQWVRFWFTPTDPAPLGFLRILVGGMLVYSHLVWGIELESFLGDNGWNSAEVIHAYQRNQWNSSFWWYVPAEWMQAVHYTCIAALVLFWIGFLTRLTSVLSYVILVSYCQRAALANYGLDQILSLLLFYLMIGPSGAAYSIDNILRRVRWSRRRRRLKLESVSPVIVRSASAGLALRLIQVHYCIIYFFAGTGKLQGVSWWTGEAMWRVIANYEYQSISLVWLYRSPEVIQFITHIVIIWELSFAYIVWVRPLRRWVLAIGLLMHLGIGAFFGMWTFGFAMMFGYVAFLKPETVRAIAAGLNSLFTTGVAALFKAYSP